MAENGGGNAPTYSAMSGASNGSGGVHPRPIERSHRQPVGGHGQGEYLHPPPPGFTTINGQHPHTMPYTHGQGVVPAPLTSHPLGRSGAENGAQEGGSTRSHPSDEGRGGDSAEEQDELEEEDELEEDNDILVKSEGGGGGGGVKKEEIYREEIKPWKTER